MASRDDECRLTTDHASTNLITLKKIALDLIRSAKSSDFLQATSPLCDLAHSGKLRGQRFTGDAAVSSQAVGGGCSHACLDPVTPSVQA